MNKPKKPEDLFNQHAVIFMTKAQKEKLLKYCAKNHTTMCEWARENIENLE
jgi:hypothetical protein